MEITRGQKILSVIVVVFIITLLLRMFVVEGFVVKGDSMEPAIHNGDFIFINRLAYKFGKPRRADVVVAIPRNMNIKVVKRIIGMPGERISIEEGKIVLKSSRGDEGTTLSEIYLQNQNTPSVGTTLIQLDPEEYFALGDNRAVSIDSRELGPLDLWEIKGRVIGLFRLSSLKYQGL